MQQQQSQEAQPRNHPTMVKFRESCLARGVSGIRSIGKAFLRADDNGNKTLDFNEFSQVVDRCQVSMSREEMQELFSMFDKDGGGTINYEEFLYHLRPPMSKARTDLIKKVYQKIDVTGDGVVTVEDVAKKYDASQHPKYKSGEYTKKQVFQEFLNTFQQGGQLDEVVTFDEFLNYYAGVSCSIDKDVYFDYMIRQAWKI